MIAPKTPNVFERRAPAASAIPSGVVQRIEDAPMAGIDELAVRINSPAGDDSLLKFEGPMTMEQIGDQLRALRDKARREQIR